MVYPERVSLKRLIIQATAATDGLFRRFTPLPKSDTPSRIKSNIEVFDFELEDADMKELDAQDQGSKGALAPYNLNCA